MATIQIKALPPTRYANKNTSNIQYESLTIFYMTLHKLQPGNSLFIRPFIIGMLSVLFIARLYDYGYTMVKLKFDSYQAVILKK